MFSNKELIDRSRQYFEDKEVQVMHAVTDGNFFHASFETDARSHAQSNKLEVITITREDLKDKASAKPAKEKAPAKAKESKPEEEAPAKEEAAVDTKATPKKKGKGSNN